MKVTLEFTLPEEAYEHAVAMNGAAYRCIIQDLDEWLRSQIKHGDRNELQPARDKLWELIKDEGVSNDIHG